MRKSEEEQSGMLLRYGKSILIGGGVGGVASLLFLLLAAIGISMGLFGMGLQYQLVVVSCVAGSFLGGGWAVRRCASQRLIVGIGVGAVLFLLQLTLGLLLFDAAALENGGIGLLFGDLCGGAAAGLLTRGQKKRLKKTRKKKRG